MFTQHKIHYTFYSSETYRSLSHPKDRVDIGKQNNVIYKIPCSDCEAVYISESKRSLAQRSSEHKHAVKNGDTDKNEISDHSWKNDHRFNFEEKSLIDCETNTVSRKDKETIHSIVDKNHINSISYALPDTWLPTLSK